MALFFFTFALSWGFDLDALYLYLILAVDTNELLRLILKSTLFFFCANL